MAKRLTIDVKSNRSIEFIDITSTIQQNLKQFDVANGLLLIFTPHTTAGITINENADPSVKTDIKSFLEKKIPNENYFQHMEGNSHAHIMSSLFSASETVIVENGRMVLGTWQGIFFCEFDGPRRRKVFLKLIPD